MIKNLLTSMSKLSLAIKTLVALSLKLQTNKDVAYTQFTFI